MGDSTTLGRTRLYSVSAAVTCTSCGTPMFLERQRVHEVPAGDLLTCAVCGARMRLALVLIEECEE